MPTSYSSRKHPERAYFLHTKIGPLGNPLYFFTRKAEGAIDVPPGFSIRETRTGILYITRGSINTHDVLGYIPD